MRKGPIAILVFAGLAIVLFSSGIIPSASRIATSRKRPNWTDQPFTIGPPSKYTKPGVYFDFANTHGVYIVSHRSMIVALSVDNPYNNKPTRYDDNIKQYVDRPANHRFTTNGLITGVSGHVRKMLNDHAAVKKALAEDESFPRSLERCYIKLQGEPADRSAQLSVNPRHRFIQELNQWSRQYSAYMLDK